VASSENIAREVIEYLVTVLRSEREVMQARARLQYTAGALFLAEHSHLLSRPVLEELSGASPPRHSGSAASLGTVRVASQPHAPAPRSRRPTRQAIDLMDRQLILAGAERDIAEPHGDIEATEGIAFWQADALIWAFAEMGLLDEHEYKEWLALLHA
jgi:hypothetical protein